MAHSKILSVIKLFLYITFLNTYFVKCGIYQNVPLTLKSYCKHRHSAETQMLNQRKILLGTGVNCVLYMALIESICLKYFNS